ncbi:hypothetical protein Tco_1233983 [Tanacetum coccineum]
MDNNSSAIGDGAARGTTTVISSYPNLGEISVNPSMVSLSVGFGESNRAQNPNSGKPVTRFGDFADIMNAPSNVIPQQHQDVGVPLSNTIGAAAPFALRNGKYADILSTMSSADIDAAVNAIVTIGMKFQDEVNKAGSTQLSSSPNVNTSSPLVSPSTTINVPRKLNSIDVVATFRVPLTTVGDLHKLINDIEAGKHEELLYGMTNDDRMKTLDALDIDNNPSVIASPNSYAGAAGASVKEQPNVISNFRPLVADPVYDGVNISIPRKVIEKIKLHDVPLQVFEEDGINLIATFIGKPIMLDSYTSSMCKDSWGRSSFARCLIKVNSEADLVDVVTIGIPSLTGGVTFRIFSPLVVTTSNVVAPTVEKTNDGFQTVGKKKKRKGPRGDDFTKETIRVDYEWRLPKCDECKILGHVHDHCPTMVVSPHVVTTSNVVAPTVEKTNDGFQTTVENFPKKDNFTTSNSFSALNEEEVENVYNESANLFKTDGSSTFTTAAG